MSATPPADQGQTDQYHRTGHRSAMIGGDNSAPIVTGDGNQVTMVQAQQATVFPAGGLDPVAEVPERPGLTNLPPLGLFVGRHDDLAALDAKFAEASDVVVCAVHGLGGIGKSTLAVR